MRSTFKKICCRFQQMLWLWLLLSHQVLLPLPAIAQQFYPQQINADAHQQLIVQRLQPQRRSALQPRQQPSQPRPSPVIAHGLPTQQRAKIKGYKTDERSERQVSIVVDCSAPHNGQCEAGTNFNPAIAGGIRGSPGILARLNPRGFQYLSTIAGGILNYFIKRARLPNISQCIPQVNGCINVYNLYVSRYRCPQRVTVYPSPPNQIVIDVQNLDIGVTGNLGGQIVILIPIALFGIVQVNAHQVSVRIAVTIVNGADGGPRIQMVSCAASVGYVDVYIQNGGLIGDIANSQFRGKISEMVRQQIPGQLCQRLPGIIDSELNSRLSQKIPRLIPVSQLLQIAINAFGLNNLIGSGQCPASCNGRKAAALGTSQKSNGTVLVLPPHLQTKQQQQEASLANFTESNNAQQQLPSRPSTIIVQKEQHPALNKGAAHHLPINGGLNSGKTLNRARMLSAPNGHGPPLIVNSGTAAGALQPNNQSSTHLHRRQLIFAPLAPHAMRPARAALMGAKAMILARPRGHRATPSESGRLTFVDPGENFCSNCPNTGGQESPLGFLGVILQSMDLSKLNNIYLNVQVMNTYATNQDFTIELNGEFSVCGRGCTPFGAFPMQFPGCVNCADGGSGGVGGKMLDILISDFTINSLLYHLHNVGFLRVRVGPETPKIGDLLKTTCGDSEGDEGELEDHGVETEDGTLATKRRRRKRQDAGDLASLGICLGDILPAVRERYPDQKVYIIISSERAPSVILSARNGGTAIVDFVLNADFYIQSTNERVGTIRIAATVDVTVRPRGNRISAHADITRLNLQDVNNQLGLPQDALDNLGNLGKEIILKAGNDALERGSSLSVPNGIAGLPVNIVDPEIHFLEHALLISTDFTINPNELGGSEPC